MEAVALRMWTEHDSNYFYRWPCKYCAADAIRRVQQVSKEAIVLIDSSELFWI